MTGEVPPTLYMLLKFKKESEEGRHWYDFEEKAQFLKSDDSLTEFGIKCLGQTC